MSTQITGRAADINPKPEALIARAKAMIPTLKERAARCEAERKVPDETVREMKEAGFFDVLKPRRWGGFEMEPKVFFEIQMALAEGCMSTAWIYGVIGVHPLQLGLFPLKAQEDVWSKDPSILISSSYQPVGKVEPADGGYLLTGQWAFSSGCDHCDWVFLGAIVPPGPNGGTPEYRTFLVPRSDYKILDTWYTLGLKGTGSQDIKVDRVFVPEHRTHRAIDGYLCRNPGQQANDGEIFKLPWAQVFVRAVSSAAIGATQAALNDFLNIARTRVSTNTGMATKADPFALAAAARTASELEQIRTTLFRNFDVMMDAVRGGREITVADRLFYKYQSSQVARRCADLVDDLLLLAGARGIFLDNPMVRPWLDLKAARAHIANNSNGLALSVGASYLGAEIPDTFL
ncbi:MAG TPA: acyl-CoA dehydrogenase family protein [Alphaproteobacteria bacterium]|nr:acyl-CoA dehydrogenase family protein [Alphaproteobacteria bacterium]